MRCLRPSPINMDSKAKVKVIVVDILSKKLLGTSIYHSNLSVSNQGDLSNSLHNSSSTSPCGICKGTLFKFIQIKSHWTCLDKNHSGKNIFSPSKIPYYCPKKCITHKKYWLCCDDCYIKGDCKVDSSLIEQFNKREAKRIALANYRRQYYRNRKLNKLISEEGK